MANSMDLSKLNECSIGLNTKVRMERGVKIPLRDGVNLRGTLYAPKHQQTPTSCLFTLTPYIGQTYHERGVYFASHGLPFLTVDVRGRGDSEGTFSPFIQEARDGYDVVEWLAKQPYCNGQVAMWGGSYGGYDQWAVAKERPAHLVTIVPAAAAHPGIDFPMRNAIPYPYIVQWLTFVSGRALQDKLFFDKPFWSARYLEWFESGKPYNQLDDLCGAPSSVFQEWVDHPHPDAYWDAFCPSAAQYAALSLPILTITGIYDVDQTGALEFYREHMGHASPQHRERHFLVIGPWDHAGTRVPKAEFGGMRFGSASLLDLQQLHLEWYRWTMQGGDRPAFLQKRVAYYLMGADRWCYADSLDGVTARVVPFFLDSSANVADEPGSGTLTSGVCGHGAAEHFTCDPTDTSRARLESTLDLNILDPEDRADPRAIPSSTGHHLVYHSRPFLKDTEITGFFRLAVWLSIDQPDTDFWVAVDEIAPDGSRFPLTNDILRARYRLSLREEVLVDTVEPLRYNFQRFTFTSRLIKAGCRLRLVIGHLNSIYSQKNYNGGGLVAEECLRDARVATVKLFHDEAHPSALYIPFGQSESERACG